MFMKEKSIAIYLLSPNIQIQIQYHYLTHASNVRVVQVSKVIDEINLKEISDFIDKSHFFKSESNNNSDVDVYNILVFINKVREHNFKGIKKLCKAYIKNKYIKIVKLKKMILIIKKLQEIYTNL